MASPVETMIRKTVTGGLMKIAQFNRDRMKASADSNPYLTGIHTPMTEERTLTELV
jgi:8'-apo-carotenoid 13,14-cleaving dioxygenase